MKQKIEIDVPDGFEVTDTSCWMANMQTNTLILALPIKKKEPEYIEVREYLITTHGGVTVHHSAQKGISSIKLIEESTNFTRWIDKDWRKVEI